MSQMLLGIKSDTSGKQSAKELLKWNQRKTLSHLLAMEEHLSDVSPKEAVHSWCIVKHHLLALDHHLSEAINHAQRAGENPQAIRKFREKLLKLDSYPEPRITVEDLIKIRTEWRYIIKDPTLTEECPICDLDYSVEALKNIRTNLNKSENDFKSDEPEMRKQTRDIVTVFGADWVGLGGVKLGQYLDVLYPGVLMGQDPSLLLDVIATIAGIIGPLRVKSPWDTLLLLIGGYMSTDLYRHIEKMMVPTVRYVARPTTYAAKTVTPVAAPTAVGKYT